MSVLTSTPSDNILTSVISYNDSLLARLLNDNPWISTANMRFKNPSEWPGNLGDTVSFDIPPQMVTNDSLVITLQPAIQRVQDLTIDKAKNVAYPFTAQQFIFNVEDYMKKFGNAAMGELGTEIGKDVAQNAIDHTFRCYDATSGGIQSYQQVAQILANFRNYGTPKGSMAKMYLHDVSIPAIIGSGLNQFAPTRNNEIANSWELGTFNQCEFYATNILSTHVAGTSQGNTLTVAAINSAGTEIDFTGAGNAKTLVEGDILTFDASHTKGLYFVTPYGHVVSSQLVQVRVTETVTSESDGTVTVSVFPALVSNTATGAYNINISHGSFVGTTATIQASHRAALVTAGDPLFLGMPHLPDEVPYPTAVSVDKESGATLRSYYGCTFGQNQRSYVHDVIYGTTMVDQNAFRIALPL